MFAFAVPVLRLAASRRQAIARGARAAAGTQGPSAAAAEHRLDPDRDGRSEPADGARRAAPRLRAGAAMLARRDRTAAQALEGDHASVAAAGSPPASRSPCDRRRRRPELASAGALVDQGQNHQRRQFRPAGDLARARQRLDVVAAALRPRTKHQLAVDLLRSVPAADPFWATVRDQRIRPLAEAAAQRR